MRPFVAILTIIAACAGVRAAEGPEGPDPKAPWRSHALSPVLRSDLRFAVAAPIPAGLKMPFPPSAGTFALRPEGRTLRADLDGDGTLDAVTEEGDVFTFHVRAARGGKRPCHYRFFRGAKRAWYFEPATAMTAEIGGERFALLDADANLRFDDVGRDAVLLGDAGWAVPLGRVMLLGGKLHHVKAEPDGRAVSLQPYRGETGVLNLDRRFRAPGRLAFAVVRSGEAWFDLAGKGGGVVPVGGYRLVRGRLEKNGESCTIVPGEMKAFQVSSAGPAAPRWGGPLRINFRPRLSGSRLHVDALLRYFGEGGEEYVDFTGPLTTPTVVVISPGGAELSRGRFETG
ncbi:MAG: hypothetical protein ACYS47_01085 [Planctomycetota bacterium]|jgi:hypothetical protein